MAAFIGHVTLDTLAALAQPAEDDLSARSPALRAVAAARNKGYDAVCVPLTTDRWRMRWRDMCLLSSTPDLESEDERADGARAGRTGLEQQAELWRANPVFVKDEVTLTRLEEAENVAILVSEWLELDAADEWVRHDAEIALNQELSYASYLNVHTAILPPPRNRTHVASYARAVSAALTALPFMQLSVRLPIYDPSMIQLARTPGTASSAHAAPLVDDHPSIATWEMWDAIRCICDYHPRLTLTLDLTPPLPAALDVLSQWVAEPTSYIFLPASTFIPNAKGYPVLPKGTQSFIRDIMKLQPGVILSGTDTERHAKGGEAAYAQYVRHLEKTSPAVKAMQTSGTVENFAQGYQDYLQAPLQPLMDNLQSMTYQTFEQDPVKYRNYEEAVFRALSEWPPADRITICVAGAGRGPLVARCLAAMKRANREAFVYAVEKNPNAFVTLQERKEMEWGDRVELIFGDMRTLDVPEKVDILVSELLGSFGDNELSPECLDGAMRFLKAEGISIPSSYTAYLTPISSSKLYNEARASKDEKAVETPYVVMFQAVNILSGDGGGLSGKCGPRIQACWEFEHPRRDGVLNPQGLPFTNSHNTRSAKLTFHIPHGGALHGLAGYFEAVLYKNVGLSIHPERMDKISKDMLSWFPIFFPFKEPLYLPSKSELQISIWRLTNQRQVWYEWYAEAFLPLPDDSLGPDTLPGREGEEAGAHLRREKTPSPLIDALDVAADATRADEAGEDDSRIGLVKVGQTTLHNPRGRSSWIGL